MAVYICTVKSTTAYEPSMCLPCEECHETQKCASASGSGIIAIYLPHSIGGHLFLRKWLESLTGRTNEQNKSIRQQVGCSPDEYETVVCGHGCRGGVVGEE